MHSNNSVRAVAIASFLTVLYLPAIAHNVEVSKEVAATFHIEPNHNPQANEPTTAWFALTRRGGNSIPLSECDCALNVYAVPRKGEGEPILQPELIPLDVEKYREIPGAEITFPQAGAYELEISGQAKDNSFAPFELTYTVNVIP
ncbi:MAG: hypothetical protein AAFQ41_12770 [Cyanobacteria bacterium J06623_7]